MKYRIVVTTVEATMVEAPSQEIAEVLARRFEDEVDAKAGRTFPVESSCRRVTLKSTDEPEGRILDAE